MRPPLLRDEVRALVALSVFMQFLLNLHTFNFVIELVLQPMLAILLGMSLVAQSRDEYAPVSGWPKDSWSWLGSACSGSTIWQLVRSWSEIDGKQTLLSLAFSIWLPLLMLPWIYLISL